MVANLEEGQPLGGLPPGRHRALPAHGHAINDIGTEEDLLAAIDATIKHFNDGDIVEGHIVKVDRDEVLLDIGYKTEGVIPRVSCPSSTTSTPTRSSPSVTPSRPLVLQKEDKDGRLILSKKRAQYERAWGTIEKIKEEDGVVTGTVIEVVKGGLILDIGLRGFLPASLVEMRRVRDLQPYVGKEIEAKIIELDKNRNNVVLSRRAWLEQTQSEVRTTFLASCQGQVRPGRVLSIVNFGAFVDLGGVDGLVHVSELSWKHIDHPSEVVEVGDEVTVEVLDVDMDRERSPCRSRRRRRTRGSTSPGPTRSVRSSRARSPSSSPFGAFVRVEDGIEGLVHISELAERHVELPEQVVTVGSDIFVKVIDIDLERRRISLSLKQANEDGAGQASSTRPSTAWPRSTTSRATAGYPEGFDPETNMWARGDEKQREPGRSSTPTPTPAGRRTAPRSRRPRPPTPRLRPTPRSPRATAATRPPRAASPRAPRLRPRRAPWPRMRLWLRCARSSPATEPHGIPLGMPCQLRRPAPVGAGRSAVPG